MGRVRATRTKSRDCGQRGKSRSLIGRGGFKCLALIGSQERDLHDCPIAQRRSAATRTGATHHQARPCQARPESEETGRKWQLKWGGVQWGRPSRPAWPAWPARTGRRRQHPLSLGWGGVGRSSRPSTRPPWPPWAAVPWPAGRSPGRQLASYLTATPDLFRTHARKKVPCFLWDPCSWWQTSKPQARTSKGRSDFVARTAAAIVAPVQRAALDRVSQADAA